MKRTIELAIDRLRRYADVLEFEDEDAADDVRDIIYRLDQYTVEDSWTQQIQHDLEQRVGPPKSF